MPSNPLNLDWIEAVLDGLGGSAVTGQRFFDVPARPITEFGNDDSVVFWLICTKVTGLPKGVGLWMGV